MFNSTEIASLKEQCANLSAELNAEKSKLAEAASELSTVKASLETIKGEKATLESSVSELTTKLSEADAAKTAAEAKAAAAEASIEAKVTERLASAGVDPVKRDPQAKTGEMKTAPDASLPPIQRATAAVSAWSIFSKN